MTAVIICHMKIRGLLARDGQGYIPQQSGRRNMKCQLWGPAHVVLKITDRNCSTDPYWNGDSNIEPEVETSIDNQASQQRLDAV